MIRAPLVQQTVAAHHRQSLSAHAVFANRLIARMPMLGMVVAMRGRYKSTVERRRRSSSKTRASHQSRKGGLL